MLEAIDLKVNFRALKELINLLKNHLQLTIEMAKREITSRYTGQILGVFWAIGHPLTLMLVYTVIFGGVFKAKIGGASIERPLNYTVYLLSGLIPWISSMESMSKSTGSIIANAGLVKQFIFPLEILPVKGVIASLFTEIIFFILLFIYMLVSSSPLFWTYLLLPLLIFFQVLAMIGISYILSAVSVYFRDTKDFIQVFSTVGVYIIPAFYQPEFIPKMFLPIIYINPFSHMIWCFQDALYFGRFDHPYSWGIFCALSIFIFIIGYRLFRRLKIMFGNVL